MSQEASLYEMLKALSMSAILNNNLEFAKKLLNMMESMSKEESNHNTLDKNLMLLLQDKTDLNVATSYNTRLSYQDTYYTIYEKIYVNIYLKLVTEDKDSQNNFDNEILDNYDGDKISLKQSILLCLIKGNNTQQMFEDFVRMADKLLATELDLNFVKLTYDGHLFTPYQYAKYCGYNRIAQYLVEHGATPNE